MVNRNVIQFGDGEEGGGGGGGERGGGFPLVSTFRPLDRTGRGEYILCQAIHLVSSQSTIFFIVQL